MTMPTKLLVLGIDGASPEMLAGWAAEGALPNLAALEARGLTGETTNVHGFHVGSTWPSITTGLTPARHGVHYTVQIRPGSYDFHTVIARPLVARDPFWAAISRAGRRVAILDVPLSTLDRSLNGIQSVEWGSHDAIFGFRATPPEVESEIRERFGRHPLGPSCDGLRASPRETALFIDALIRGVGAKGELTKHFLRQGGWDLFMQVFTESHCVGHQCWHLHDRRHPAYDAPHTRVTGDPLLRVYTAIDAAIGQIVDEAGEDAKVVVFCGHGMSYFFGAQFLLREILFRLGVAHPKVSSAPGGPGDMMLAGARRAWRMLPGVVRHAAEPLRALLRDDPHATGVPNIGVDPNSSSCFVVPNGLAVGGIRLNLRGREPRGILPPGAEADGFCDDLRNALLEIRDERTRHPVIRAVHRTRDLYEGEHIVHLPDLLVEWTDEVPTGSAVIADGRAAHVRITSPRIGTIEGANDYGRTGEHRPAGRFIAAGPGITPGHLDRTVSILDYAPTFAAICGVELTGGDGGVIAELT